MSRLSVIAVFAFVSALGPAWAEDNLKAYPPAEQGMVRHVVQLPKQDDEGLFQVELIAGKKVQLDGVNHYSFGGKIEEKVVEGWGYPRYDLKKLGPMMGTLIGVDPSVPKVDRFVTLGGGPHLIRYNSQLPIVVYAPEGVTIQYRIWRAEAKATVAEKG